MNKRLKRDFSDFLWIEKALLTEHLSWIHVFNGPLIYRRSLTDLIFLKYIKIGI